MEKFNIGLYRFLLCIVFSSVHYTYAQELPDIIPPSPQSQEFQKYGNYPVSNFTGVPDISIPLHQINYYGYQMPITLRYHSAGVKAGVFPDVYGLGWSLLSGGEISRTVHHVADEFYDFNKGIDISSTDPSYFDKMMELANGVPWHGDIAYDEFNVTLPDGTSFKFYIQNVSGEYKIYTNPQPLPVKISFSHSPNNIEYFDIIDDQGVKYHFSAFETFSGTPITYKSTWKLTKIVLPNINREILFKYKRDDGYDFNKTNYTRVVCDSVGKIGPYQNEARGGVSICSQLGGGPVSNEVYSTGFSGYAYASLVPDSIIFGDASIKFDYFEDADSRSLHLNRITLNDVEKEITFSTSWFNSVERIGRLDSITIQDIEQTRQALKYQFGYVSDLYTPDSDDGYDHWGYIVPTTKVNDPHHLIFSQCGPEMSNELNTYNAPAFFLNLANPVFNKDTCLFNSWEIGGEPYYSAKIGNSHRGPMVEPPFALNRIDYPTGGYTLFKYHCNTYYDSISSQIQNGGGYRIESISNYSDGQLKEKKTYKYGVNECNYGFAPVVPSAKTYQKTHIDWFVHPADSEIECRYRERHFNSNNFLSLLGNRPPVMYPEVTEYIGDENGNIGKTVYKYQLLDNYDEGLKVNFAGDYYVLNDAHWYYGQLIEKKVFANDNGYKLKKKIEQEWLYSYYHILDDKRGLYWYDKAFTSQYYYDNFGTRTPYFSDNIFQSNPHFIRMGKAKLWKIKTITYSNESNAISTLKEFDYGDHGYVIAEAITNSDNNTYTRLYKYPHDGISTEGLSAANLTAIDTMIARNIVSPVLQETSLYDNNLITSKRNVYNLFSNRVFPESIKIKHGATAVEEEMVFEKYDSYGNILQQSRRNDSPTSFFWGYDNKYPIIKAENCEYTILETAINNSLPPGFSSLEDLLTSPGGIGELTTLDQKAIWRLFNANLREQASMNRVIISTYTYLPFIGTTSATDANGFTTYYGYDGMGRLDIVKDNKGNILNEYDYHYYQN